MHPRLKKDTLTLNFRLRAVSFCSSESVEETQKSSGELKIASKSARYCQSLTDSFAASPLDFVFPQLLLRSRKRLLVVFLKLHFSIINQYSIILSNAKRFSSTLSSWTVVGCSARPFSASTSLTIFLSSRSFQMFAIYIRRKFGQQNVSRF